MFFIKIKFLNGDWRLRKNKLYYKNFITIIK